MSARGKVPWANHLRLVLSTVVEHSGTDPVVFALQVSRRLPAGLMRCLGRPLIRSTGFTPAIGAVACHIAGQDERLDDLLDAASRTYGRYRQKRRLAEVALAVDAVDHAFRLTADLPLDLPGAAGTRARRDWYLGEMSAAVVGLQRAWLTGVATRGEQNQLMRLADERAQFQGVTPSLRRALGEDLCALAATYRPRENTVVHVLTNSVPHTSSGYALRSHSLLSAQAQQGWTVHAMTRPGYPVQVGKLAAAEVDVIDGVTYHRITPGHLPSTATGRLELFAQELLVRCLLTRPAVLHTTTHFVNALVVQEVATVLGIPWVYEVRGQLADTWASRRPPVAATSERYRCFTAREAAAAAEADDVAALGGTMAQRIQEITAGQIQAGDVRLVPNAVGPFHEAEPEPVEVVRERLNLGRWGLSTGQFLVGSVTSVVDYEGLDDLIRALLHVPEDIHAVIVGDGAARPGLQELAKSLGLADRVVFVGRVNQTEARAWQRALDVFVVPRRDRVVTRAVTPLKIVEASASEVPVIASNLPAIAETIRHNVTGLLVEPENPQQLADSIVKLWADRGMGHRLGQAGRQAVLTHRTWSAVAAGTISQYLRMVTARDLASEQGTSSRRTA
ncbi:glycosyltransferase family 4 protein [Kocuria sp.]|uniref:glycosyltransferase family 4 protein n=1 Tax=Kocuria sp. TaxID=1871328 RepID=UPI0026DF6E54|nr:glycosyltransferase family 4 protein [Kocuria sp.]MDO5617792.1 glycosyltransferase family 4 protein [Kocuria sp.]